MIQKEILKLKPEKILITDESGKSLGVFSFQEAIKLAEEKNLDLFLLNTRTNPVVARLGDYKKYLYLQEKKKKGLKKPKEQKIIQISVNEAIHDLQRKATQAQKFLDLGYPVQIKMLIRGRQQLHHDFAKEKFLKFLDMIERKKITQPLKENSNMIIAYLAKI